MNNTLKENLLIAALFLFFAAVLYAQDQDEPPENELQIFVATYPIPPLAGEKWTITLFVDHPAAEEVTVIAPQFARWLSLDRVYKAPRVIETKTFTAVEYRFNLNSPGRYTLEPFTIITPFGIAETSPFALDVQTSGTQQRLIVPRIIWEGVPRQIAAGERAVFDLRVNEWDASEIAEDFFMPTVPVGVILVKSALTAQERLSGLAIRLELVPIIPGNFRLGARTLQYENIRFDIPALQIRITDSAAKETALLNLESHDETETALESKPQFPQLKKFPLSGKNAMREPLQKEYEKIYWTAKDLWDGGFYAQSLAELRKNERESRCGAFLQPLRQQAEESLNLYNTENESRAGRNFQLAAASLVFFLVIISPFACLISIKKPRRRKTAILCAVVIAALCTFFLYGFLASKLVVLQLGKSRFGVTRETPVRKLADFDGEKLFTVREGQPVITLLNSGSWIFIRTRDNAEGTGWIPAENVIF